MVHAPHVVVQPPHCAYGTLTFTSGDWKGGSNFQEHVQVGEVVGVKTVIRRIVRGFKLKAGG